MTAASGLIEVFIADTFRISGRGTVAHLVDDPKPWWPWSAHRVHVVKPDGIAFEAMASVEFALLRGGEEAMVLVFHNVEAGDLPPGSRVASLEAIPYQRPIKSEPVPYRRHVKSEPVRKWWQVWKRWTIEK